MWLSACTTYERQVAPFKMPAAYPNATAVADATIAAKAYDNKEEATAAFGFDIRGAGILPVQVIFDNTGTHPLEILTDHLKPLPRSLLNLLENMRNLRYCRARFHGAFSFRSSNGGGGKSAGYRGGSPWDGLKGCCG